MMRKLFLFFSLFLFQLMVSQEREAVLIFRDSTEIKGLGEIKNDKIYFRVSEKDKLEYWDDQIVIGLNFTGYGFSERYEYVEIGSNVKPDIMELIEKGSVSLYREVYENYFATPRTINFNGEKKIALMNSEIAESYYVKRDGNSKVTELSTKDFKIKALKFFADCKEVVEMIKDNDFTKEDILDLVIYYNKNCGK